MMKLSEAIRLGAMMKPQSFKDIRETKTTKLWFLGYLACNEIVVATCALGSAMDAIGLLPLSDARIEDEYVPPDEWRTLLDFYARCHVCGDYDNDDVECVIQHLNDDHELTRETIADWVESIEAAHPEVYAAVQGEVSI
jgi:hypothetical protein